MQTYLETKYPNAYKKSKQEMHAALAEEHPRMALDTLQGFQHPLLATMSNCNCIHIAYSQIKNKSSSPQLCNIRYGAGRLCAGKLLREEEVFLGSLDQFLIETFCSLGVHRRLNRSCRGGSGGEQGWVLIPPLPFEQAAIAQRRPELPTFLPHTCRSGSIQEALYLMVGMQLRKHRAGRTGGRASDGTRAGTGN